MNKQLSGSAWGFRERVEFLSKGIRKQGARFKKPGSREQKVLI